MKIKASNLWLIYTDVFKTFNHMDSGSMEVVQSLKTSAVYCLIETVSITVTQPNQREITELGCPKQDPLCAVTFSWWGNCVSL